MPEYVLGADLSHYQGSADFAALGAGGVQFVILKATEGRAVDPLFDRNRGAAAAQGLVAFAYPFLTPADDAGTVAHFLSVTEGMIPALDWEMRGVRDAVVERWIASCQAALGRTGLAYYGIAPPDAVAAPIAAWPRWFPEYAAAPRLPPWDGGPGPDWSREWLIWQYSGSGRASGIAGAVDLNRLACPIEVLRHWHDTGAFPAWGAGAALA